MSEDYPRFSYCIFLSLLLPTLQAHPTSLLDPFEVIPVHDCRKVKESFLFYDSDRSLPYSDWRTFGEVWYDNVRRKLDENIQAITTLVTSKDSRINDLEHLGFEFFFTQTGFLAFKVPRFDEFISRYYEKLERYLADGILKPEGVLIPGLAFEDEDGNEHFLSPRQRPKSGWVAKDVFRDPLLLARMQTAGYFPLSHNWRALHDSCHLAGFIANPDFMSNLRSAASPARVRGSRLRGSSEDFRVRFLFLHEGFALVPEENRASLQRILSRSVSSSTASVVTVEEVRRYYNSLDDQQVRDQAANILSKLPPLIRYYSQSEIGSVYRNAELLLGLPCLIDDVTESIDEGGELLAFALARLEVAAWLSTRVSVDGAFEELFAPVTDPSKPFFQMIVTSGLGESNFPPGSDITGNSLYRSLVNTAR